MGTKRLLKHRFDLKLNFGYAGVDDSPVNPINRALDRSLRTGRPIQKIGSVIVDLPDENGHLGPRWLGTYVFSAGERLIFFPAYSKAYDRLVMYSGKTKSRDQESIIDHISLEKDRDTWHLTTPNSTDHFPAANVLPLSGNTGVWFGMSIASPTVLRAVKRQTTIRYNAPTSDAKRRETLLFDAFHDVENLRMELDPRTFELAGPYFYHFAVAVGDPGMLNRALGEFALPYGSPWVEPAIPDDCYFIASSQCLHLGQHCSIQITATRVPGSLNIPIQFTTPSVRQTTTTWLKVHPVFNGDPTADGNAT